METDITWMRSILWQRSTNAAKDRQLVSSTNNSINPRITGGTESDPTPLPCLHRGRDVIHTRNMTISATYLSCDIYDMQHTYCTLYIPWHSGGWDRWVGSFGTEYTTPDYSKQTGLWMYSEWQHVVLRHRKNKMTKSLLIVV